MLNLPIACILVEEGQNEKALEVLDKCMEVIPTTSVPADYSTAMLAEYYYELGQTEKADALIRPLLDDCIAKIEWVKSLKSKHSKAVSQELSIRQNVGLIQNMWMTARNYDSELSTELEENLQKYYPLVRN